MVVDVIPGTDTLTSLNNALPAMSAFQWSRPSRLGCALFSWTVGDESLLAIVFVQVTDGRIVRITDFWPDR